MEVIRIKASRPSWRAWHSGSLHPLQKKRTSHRPLQQHRAWQMKGNVSYTVIQFLFYADTHYWLIICVLFIHTNMKFRKVLTTYKILLSIFPMGLYFRFCWELSWIKSDTSFSIWTDMWRAFRSMWRWIRMESSTNVLVYEVKSPSSWRLPSVVSPLLPSSWVLQLVLERTMVNDLISVIITAMCRLKAILIKQIDMHGAINRHSTWTTNYIYIKKPQYVKWHKYGMKYYRELFYVQHSLMVNGLRGRSVIRVPNCDL